MNREYFQLQLPHCLSLWPNISGSNSNCTGSLLRVMEVARTMVAPPKPDQSKSLCRVNILLRRTGGVKASKCKLVQSMLFVKYLFAHDKLNYACLTPVYLGDMKALAQTDTEVWEEFMEGNWVVNKKMVPFCAIGPDHALEQVNRMMKVAEGLIGIWLNTYAHTKLFLVAPELARLAEEARNMVIYPRPKRNIIMTSQKQRSSNKRRMLWISNTPLTNSPIPLQMDVASW